MTLDELAAKVEALPGPSREVDGWIHAHMTRGDRYIIGNEPGRFPQKPIYGERLDVMKSLTADGAGAADYIGAPHYTASLDAAITLVPEGCIRHIEWCEGRVDAAVFVPDSPDLRHGYAATPALALVAALLRALSQEKTNGSR